MNTNNELQEDIKLQDEYLKIEKKSFGDKVKKYIKESEFLSKLIVIIPSVYAAIYFVQNLIYKINCENLYGIPANYFRYNSDHNIIVILDLIFVIGMFFYAYFLDKDKKQLKMDYITDWLYKLGTGLLTAIVCSAIYFEMVEKLIMKNNIFIDIIILILFIVIFICGTASIFVVFGKKHKYVKICAFIVAVPLMVTIFGIVHELNPLNKEKTAYEFVKIEDEEYAVLSKVDDKILIVPFEYDQLGKCHIKTAEYSFKNKYEGTYYYKDFKYYPIIEK